MLSPESEDAFEFYTPLLTLASHSEDIPTLTSRAPSQASATKMLYPTYFPPPSEENSGGQDKLPVFKFLLVQLICCCFLSFSAAKLNMKCIFTELEKPMTKEGWFFSFFLESCLLTFTHNCFENFLCCLLINLTISEFICSSSSHS